MAHGSKRLDECPAVPHQAHLDSRGLVCGISCGVLSLVWWLSGCGFGVWCLVFGVQCLVFGVEG